MDKKQLLGIVRDLLETDRTLSFLSQLGESDLEILAASIRARIEAEARSRLTFSRRSTEQ